MNIELIKIINFKNEYLKKELELDKIKKENINWLLKKVAHDSLNRYINNFDCNWIINEKQYFLYLDNIVDHLNILIKKEEFTIEDLLELHKNILKPLKKVKVKKIWKLRTRWVITREKVYNVWLVGYFIPGNKVKKYTKKIFNDYKQNTNNLEKVIILYNYLIAKIHPFNNWNGRTLSILLDTLLIKYNYFPLFLWWQNKYKRVIISENYIKDRNINKLISESYKIIIEIYSNYKIK